MLEIPVYHPSDFFDEANAVWLGNLQTAGAHPEDIDYVFCTHLHSDHCGWNTHLVDGRWVPTFPNAKYVFARDEFEAMESENSLIFVENVQPILEARQAVLVDLDYALESEFHEEMPMTSGMADISKCKTIER